MAKSEPTLAFEVFNEIGIIEQLSRALLEARLPDGLIAPHFSVLNHLIRVGDGRTPIAIARAFQVPKTSMTHTLKTLQDHGLVDLRPNPQDGRSKQVWLTEKGRHTRNRTIEAMTPDFIALDAQIPADRLGSLLPVLRELRCYLDAARSEPQTE